MAYLPRLVRENQWVYGARLDEYSVSVMWTEEFVDPALMHLGWLFQRAPGSATVLLERSGEEENTDVGIVLDSAVDGVWRAVHRLKAMRDGI